jgi:hypothetical protein
VEVVFTMEQLTLTLPAGLLEKARIMAGRAGRTVDAVLVEAIERSLDPLGDALEQKPVTQWPDEEVLSAADGQMPPEREERLSELLDRQQAGRLADAERPELTALMELYQRLLLRKAQALAEAVRRGLREPVRP